MRTRRVTVGRLFIALTTSLFLTSSHGDQAEATNWSTPGPGDWANAANWGGMPVPGPFDAPWIGQGNPYIRSDVGQIAGTTIDAGAPNVATLNIEGGGSLWITQNAQVNGGAIAQQGGVLQVDQTLALGTSTSSHGTYSLSGGSFSAQNLMVGDQGVGAFAQSGGQAAVRNRITIGNAANCRGNYQISGGNIEALELYIGREGTGSMVQMAGFVQVAQGIVLGETSGGAGGGQGNYQMSGGVLGAGNVTVGLNGQGSFAQTGGRAGMFALYLGGQSNGRGEYHLSGVGTALNVNEMRVGKLGQGSFFQTGGAVNVETALRIGDTSSGQGYYEITAGTLDVGSLAIAPSGGQSTLRIAGSGAVSANTFIDGQGNLVIDGGSLTIGDGKIAGIDSFTLGSTAGTNGSYRAEADTKVKGTMIIGQLGTGRYVQATARTSIDHQVVLGANVGGVGTYQLLGGLLEAPLLVVGQKGTGILAQTGGTVQLFSDGLIVGQEVSGQGTYQLSGAASQLNGAVVVGNSGTGLLEQDGGTATVNLSVGKNAGGSGTYRLRDGTLNSPTNLRVGVSGAGTLEYTGGTLNFTGGNRDIILGENAGARGTLVVGGTASLNPNVLAVGYNGTGRVEQSGGEIFANTVFLGQMDGSGSYAMTGGTLHANDLFLKNNAMTIGGTGLLETSSVDLGRVFGTTGAMAVSENGRWRQNNVLWLGDQGHATLRVIDGGRVSTMSDGIEMGRTTTGEADVAISGPGSRLSARAQMSVANAGRASITLSNGGELFSGWDEDSGTWEGQAFSIAENASGRAEVAIDGRGSQMVSGGEMVVARAGAVQLNVSDGGAVSAGVSNMGSLMVGDMAGSNAQIAVTGTGSRVSAYGPVTLGRDGQVGLTLTDGGQLRAGWDVEAGHWLSQPMQVAESFMSSAEVAVRGANSELASGGDLRIGGAGSASVLAADGGRILANRADSGGVLAIGSDYGSAASLSVDGNGSQADGHRVLIGGENGSPDRVSTVSLTDGASLQADQDIEVRRYGSLRAERAAINAERLVVRNESPGVELDGAAVDVGNLTIEMNTSLLLANRSRVSIREILFNDGLIQGGGTVGGSLMNGPSGTVRVSGTDYLTFTGPTIGSPESHNNGQINLLGGAIEFRNSLINEGEGTISGRGSLLFGQTMTNHGKINLGGDADIYGRVVNGQEGSLGSDGEIIISGGASAAFYGDVVHNGVKFKVSPNADAAFFGQVSGAGGFTGGGGVWFEGGYSPGNSPAWIDMGVDITYGDDSDNTVELAGYDAVGPGNTQYDVLAMDAGRRLQLAGTLKIDLLDGFLPDVGSSFDIFRYDEGFRTGEFAALVQPDNWLPGRYFEVSYGATAVTLTAVPEPNVLILLSIALAAAACFRLKSAKK